MLGKGLNAETAEVRRESHVLSFPRGAFLCGQPCGSLCLPSSAILRDLCVQGFASSVISVTSVVKPAIHPASVWYSVDRPLGECLEIVESPEGIAFQRASGMSRILRIQKIRTGVRNQ
jgi:hypothetical protein